MLQLKCTGLVLTPVNALECAEGSIDVQVQIEFDTTYATHTKTLHIGYFDERGVEHGVSSSLENDVFKIPGPVFAQAGIIFISVHFSKTGDTTEPETNAVQYRVQKTAGGVGSLPGSYIWEPIVKGFVNDYLNSNEIELETDKTLKLSGKPADAKVTGVRLDSLDQHAASRIYRVNCTVDLEGATSGSIDIAYLTEGKVGDYLLDRENNLWRIDSIASNLIVNLTLSNLNQVAQNKLEIEQLKKDIANKVKGIGIKNIMAITQEDYDSLEVKDSQTLYIISDETGTDIPDVPDEPINPDVTLTNLSVTYTGGEVTVGTALEDLTGITVTAIYSNGSTKNVTEYGISGTIKEGENTITVSYGGLTATFTVNGVALPTTYKITNNLTHITTNNTATSVYGGNTYNAILTPSQYYSIDSVKVTMGGVDVTSQFYSDGTINIPNVTGDIVITANGVTSMVTMPYLLSDKNCYVNTGYAINQNTTAFEITLKDEVATANRYYMGTFESNFVNEGGKWFASKLIATRMGYSINDYTKKHTHKRTLQETFVDGVSVATTTTVPSWHDAYQKYVTLFAYNNAKFDATPNVNPTGYADFYFYGAKIWEGESLVRDLVPAKDSNGVACVYDNVTQQYLYNEGTGTLTYGESLEVA